MTPAMDIRHGNRRQAIPVAPLVGPVVLAFLVAPFVALVFLTNWSRFRLVSGDVGAISVSLVYGLVALPIIAFLGTPLAWWLARGQFRGKTVAEALILLPLLSPPLALGILLASFYGPYSGAGMFIERMGITLTNSAPAFILAQVYGALPYFVVTTRTAFESIPVELEQIALTLGSPPWRVFLEITLPLSRLGIAAGLALAWVRALGEFGIVLIIAYYPRGIPVKLWVNLQDFGLSSVFPLLWLFFLVALPLPLWLGIVARRHLGRPLAS